MKRILSILLVLLFSFQIVQSQVTEPLTENSQQNMFDFYSHKAKKQKTTGFILLGVGLAVGISGLAIFSNNFWENDGGTDAGAIMFLAGSISVIASVPVLIISGSNNRKAKTYLEAGTVKVGNITFENSKYVTVGLKIDF